MNGRSRTARAASRMALAGALIAWLAWGLGRLLGPRAHLVQYLGWIPTSIIVVVSGACVLSWWWLSWSGGVFGPRRRGRWAPPLAWALLTAWLLGGEWHWQRVLWPNATDPDALRVLAWNPAWTKMAAFHERILANHPDIVLVSNPHPSADWPAFRAMMGERTYAVRQGTLVAVSRYPIRRFAWTPLNIGPEPGRPSWWPIPKTSLQGGEALLLEVAAPGFDRDLILWFVDLPSDSWISRPRMMREARQALARFQGPFFRRGDDGLDVPDQALRLGQILPHGGIEATPELPAAPGFPTPDLVMGDFNTPDHADADRIGPGLRDATCDAGIGPFATFPRRAPVLHIDHVLLGPDVRALSYRTLDLGGALHRAQLTDIAPRRR